MKVWLCATLLAIWVVALGNSLSHLGYTHAGEGTDNWGIHKVCKIICFVQHTNYQWHMYVRIYVSLWRVLSLFGLLSPWPLVVRLPIGVLPLVAPSAPSEILAAPTGLLLVGAAPSKKT